MKKAPVYIIYYPLENTVEVTRSWENAKESMRGRRNRNKKFFQQADAEKWLEEVTHGLPYQLKEV